MERSAVERARKAEKAAERVLAIIDREPHVTFKGAFVDRQWLRETLEGAAFVPSHRLSELLQDVLVEEFDLAEAKAEVVVGIMEEIVAALRRHLLS